jgi:hypothetical protein
LLSAERGPILTLTVGAISVLLFAMEWVSEFDVRYQERTWSTSEAVALGRFLVGWFKSMKEDKYSAEIRLL